jgi:hypothetical protein
MRTRCAASGHIPHVDDYSSSPTTVAMDAAAPVKPYHALGRWKRGPVRPIDLKPRDFDCLFALFTHGVLSTATVQKLAMPDRNQRTVTDRFFLLKNPPNEYVTQPAGQQRAKNANCTDLAFEIADKGAAGLVDSGRISYSDYALWNKLQSNFKPQHFDHDFATGFATASIELATRSHGLRFISWPEILNRAKCPSPTREADNPFAIRYQTSDGRRSLIPDAIFGIEYPTGACFFALEMDMGTEPLKESELRYSTIDQKLKAYRTIINDGLFRSQFALPSLIVLILTRSAVRAGNLIERLRSLAARDGKGSTSSILFNSLPQSTLGANRNPADPDHAPLALWSRAHQPDIDLFGL